MSKDKSSGLSRRGFLGTVGAVIAVGVGCGSEDKGKEDAVGQTGGTAGAGTTGGASSTTGGSSTGVGGRATGVGGSTGVGGNAARGGSTGVGGNTARGGATGVGGATGTGGRTGTGGATTSAGGNPGNGGATIGAGGSPGSGGATSGEGGNPGSGGTTTGAGGDTGVGGSGNTETALVSLVRATGDDWATAVERAIEMAGGLPDLTGKTVMVRPNVISPTSPYPATTNPEVIRGVIRAAKKKGAAVIRVTDDGFSTGSSTVSAMEALGISQVCTDEGAEAYELKGTALQTFSHADAPTWGSGVEFYTEVLEAEYIINVPVCKCHAMAGFSMALKAWYGHIPNGRGGHPSPIGNSIAELRLAKREDFVVLDATKVMTDGGPLSGTSVDGNIVVASKDPIATDITGVCIIRQFGGAGRGEVYNSSVWELEQIARAMELKFDGWLQQEADFTYLAEGVDEADEIMARRS